MPARPPESPSSVRTDIESLWLASDALCASGIGRVICLKVAEGVLNPGQQVSEHRGVRVHRRAVSETDIKHPAVSIPPDPTHRKVHVLRTHRRDARRLRALLRVDAEKDVQVVTKHRLLELES